MGVMYKRNEEIIIVLDTGDTPTGTPNFRILDSSRTKVYPADPAATEDLDGSGNLWYKTGVTVAGDATVGAYVIEYSAVHDGVAQGGHDEYKVAIYDSDDVKADSAQLLIDVAAVPTTAEINAALELAHGVGSWQAVGAGAGAYVAVINVKDDVPVNVANATVTIHNAANDDLPIIAWGTTDASGNVTVNIDGNVYVRVSKVGFVFSPTAINVNASGTYNVTGTVNTITPPINPEVSRCFISVYKLDGTVVTGTDVTLVITKHDDVTKDVNGNYATDTGITLVYDAGSETWYADIIQDTHVNITSIKVLGKDENGVLINRDFTVGTGPTTNLGAINLS